MAGRLAVCRTDIEEQRDWRMDASGGCASIGYDDGALTVHAVR